MIRRFRLLSQLLGCLLLAAILWLAPTVAASEPSVATDRWYEIRRGGQKYGHSQVVWAPSTWESRPTIHDTTSVLIEFGFGPPLK